MSNSNGTSTSWALYPLTRFDSICATEEIVSGWLIEGLLDVQKLRVALDRVVSKWPMLAGRLESDDSVYVRHSFYFGNNKPPVFLTEKNIK